MKVNALVIGAGVIGSSVAYHLARLGMTGVRVIDPDLEGSKSSTELNAGGVRATFSQSINIEMSKLSIEFFAKHAQEVGYRPVGYLWLKTPEGMSKAERGAELQRRLGWDVQSWDVPELQRRVSFIDRVDDLAGALFAPQDGLVNPNLMKSFYSARARDLGVVFDDGMLVEGMEEISGSEIEILCRRTERFTGVIQAVDDHPSSISPEARYRAAIVINCAGPWAGLVANILKYKSPTEPVRRQISIFDCRDVDLSHHGMIVDSSGVYFHPEAMNGLAGFSNTGEKPGFNFDYDGESFFTEHIWPALYERSSRFERLKHLTGWAGLYEVSPDESAIIGRAALGDRQKFKPVFEAHSFSGHGVMHCHAAGVALSELIVNGRYSTLDATPLSAERFGRGQELFEGAVI
jgi:sarcosine oxidase subunit beta